MAGLFNGKVEELFMLPQNLIPSMGKTIDISKLEKLRFFDRWLTLEKKCDYNCSKCKYCEMFYEKL